jgi:uncharacterized protein
LSYEWNRREAGRKHCNYRLRTVLRKQNSSKSASLGRKAYNKESLLSEFRMLKSLDNSAVHPEAYAIVEKMAQKVTVNDLIANKEKTANQT